MLKILSDTRLVLLGLGILPNRIPHAQLGVRPDFNRALQVGYSVADILAKCAYGFMIYAIAKAKMEDEGISVETTSTQAAAA